MHRGDCRQLFAGNLGSHATEAALMAIFRDYNIVHVKLCKERGFFGETYGDSHAGNPISFSFSITLTIAIAAALPYF